MVQITQESQETVRDEEIVVLTDLSLKRREQSLSQYAFQAGFSVLLILT